MVQQASVLGRSAAIDLRRVARRAPAPFALLALVLAGMTLYVNARGTQYGFDFHGGAWQAGQDVLAGRSPYPPVDLQRLLIPGNAFVTPPLLALIAIPFSVLPFTAAVVLWNLLSLAALAGALALLGVRDVRVYVLAICSFPFISSLALGQPDGLLALAGAAAWRWRDSRGGALAVAALIAAKLFAWPLLIWLLVTRRFRSTFVAALSTIALLGLSWASIGFKGLAQYPRLLSMDARGFEARSHSIVAAAMRLGASEQLGRVLMVAGAAGVAVIALRLSGERDLGWFTAAIAAGLLASPIMWAHYLTLLFVPLAISRQRVHPLWLLPLLFWLSPQEPPPHVWQIGLVLLTTAGITVSTVARRRSPARRDRQGDSTERVGQDHSFAGGAGSPPAAQIRLSEF